MIVRHRNLYLFNYLWWSPLRIGICRPLPFGGWIWHRCRCDICCTCIPPRTCRSAFVIRCLPLTIAQTITITIIRCLIRSPVNCNWGNGHGFPTTSLRCLRVSRCTVQEDSLDSTRPPVPQHLYRKPNGGNSPLLDWKSGCTDACGRCWKTVFRRLRTPVQVRWLFRNGRFLNRHNARPTQPLPYPLPRPYPDYRPMWWCPTQGHPLPSLRKIMLNRHPLEHIPMQVGC